MYRKSRILSGTIDLDHHSAAACILLCISFGLISSSSPSSLLILTDLHERLSLRAIIQCLHVHVDLNSFGVSVWSLVGAILIVDIPIRQCARDLICDVMMRDFLVHRILQVPSHYPASPRILLLSRNTSGSSKIRGDAGDKMQGNTRCPVETLSLIYTCPITHWLSSMHLSHYHDGMDFTAFGEKKMLLKLCSRARLKFSFFVSQNSVKSYMKP